MANTYVNIPAAAAVGPGAAVDLSTFGGLATFAGVGLQTLLVAANWVRANIVHYSSGTPQFNVGAPLLATTMLNLDVPAVAFQPSVDTTFRFQFGCDTLGVGGFVIIGAGWMKITNRSL